MDIFDKCYEFTMADDARKAGIYPFSHEITTRQHSEVEMEGRRTIMLGSNNYLGLTSDNRVIEAAKKALDMYGSGCSGSRHLNGTLNIHVELERKLAEFFGKEAAITFSTGFQTNLGIISAIAGRHDVMIYDRTNHASLIDAARLSFGKLLKYPHNDMAELERLLANVPEGRGKLIVVDGVFSMEGDLADLPEIVRLKKKYGARLMVDDSHGFGTMGATGRGVGEHFGLADEIDLYMGTFSKSFASLGGFLLADYKVADYVAHQSRPYIFSASIPPSNVAAVAEALRILEAEPERVRMVRDNAEYMRRGFRELGIPAGDSAAPIIPVMTYDDERTFKITRALLEHGVYVNPVISPAVPVGGSLLRTSYTSTHTRDQLNYALEQFDTVFNKLFPITEDEVDALREEASADTAG
jgi:8-amino-7-oxononanoate synthase